MDEAPARRFHAYPATHEGRVRDHNEDAVLVTEVTNENGLYHLWAVADGMGGGARGEDASRIAIETLEATLIAAGWHNPKDTLRQAFLDANNAVFCKGTGGGEATRSLMGTTLVAALVEEATGRFWVANVGDSRAYRIKDGKAQQITADHSLVAERVRAGLMTEADARQSSERNVITRAIGLEGITTVDLFDGGQLEDGEVLVLCSDGLHGMVDDTRIAHLASTLDSGTAVKTLLEAANEAGGTDNISVVLGDGASRAPEVGVVRKAGRRKLPVAIAGSMALCLTAVALLLAFGPKDVFGLFGSGSGQSPTLTATSSPSGSATPGPTSSPTPVPTPSPTAEPTPSPTPKLATAWQRPKECPTSVTVLVGQTLSRYIEECVVALRPTIHTALTDYCKNVAEHNQKVVKAGDDEKDALNGCAKYQENQPILQPSDDFLASLRASSQ